jgi:hypothetical protein
MPGKANSGWPDDPDAANHAASASSNSTGRPDSEPGRFSPAPRNAASRLAVIRSAGPMSFMDNHERTLTVRFGRFLLDTRRRELRMDGVLVPIGGRAFDILTMLVAADGQLVTKDELMSRACVCQAPKVLRIYENLLNRCVALSRPSSGLQVRRLGETSADVSCVCGERWFLSESALETHEGAGGYQTAGGKQRQRPI